MSRARRAPGLLVILGMAVLIAAIIVPLWGSGGRADAAGGTAKPPPGAVAPWITPTLPTPNFALNPALIAGFDVTGFYQDATVSTDNTACPNTPANKPDRTSIEAARAHKAPLPAPKQVDLPSTIAIK